MCISPEASITTFILSVCSSLVLIHYGKTYYEKENLVIGLFFIYIAIVQLLEFFLWIDLQNKIGLNQLVTLILPIYIYIQPLVLYYIKKFIYGGGDLLHNLFMLSYFGFVFSCYINYLYNEKNYITTSQPKIGLLWEWSKYFYPVPYIILFAYSIIIHFSFYISFLFIMSGILFIIISHYKNNVKNAPSLFCYLGAFTPLFFILFE